MSDHHGHGAAARIPEVCILLLAAWLAGCAGGSPESAKPSASAPESTPAPAIGAGLGEKARLEQRQAILRIRIQTLSQLYKLKPAARAEIEAAAGCGVFEINGLNAVLAGAHGRGVIFAKNGPVTYMRLIRTDLAPGAVIRPYWQVLVFHDPALLTRLTAATQAPVAVASGPGVVAYRLSDQGLSREMDLGARYARSPELN